MKLFILLFMTFMFFALLAIWKYWDVPGIAVFFPCLICFLAITTVAEAIFNGKK